VIIINEYLTHFIGNLNADYQDSISNLSDEQLYFLPNDNCCHIAFHAWHFVRTEDNIINFVCQNRKPPVWIRQSLFEKWGLPRVAQGTGMARSEAIALRLPGLSAFLQYARDVWTDIEPYLANISEEELQVRVLVQGEGEQTKLRQIMQTVMTHGNRHLGQIMALRSLQGLQGESR
jgi:DinB superfamily